MLWLGLGLGLGLGVRVSNVMPAKTTKETIMVSSLQ